MSGHSKFANIKHKKEKNDAKKGKIFTVIGREIVMAVKAGGADFSLQVFAPGTEGGFYHVHKEHEELYFFLSGEGEYQVDGKNIPVKEGTVVRVAPAGKRTVRNTGSAPLTMLCVQYKAAEPGSVNPSDGTILNEPVVW